MIEDMQMRKLAPRTQASYICAVKKLADYMGHSPHTTTIEDLRKFQLPLTDTGTSRITINTTITALRLFFETTAGDKNIVGKLKTVPVPRKLPVVLSREEVARLLEANTSLKYKAALSVGTDAISMSLSEKGNDAIGKMPENTALFALVQAAGIVAPWSNYLLVPEFSSTFQVRDM
jgi:site-specific recombinase XerC